MNSSIAVSEEASGARNFHVAGKVEASSLPQDMRLQRMLGHMSALLDHDPQVGARRRLRRRRHRRIVRAASGHQAHRDLRDRAADSAGRLDVFREENYDVVHDPRVEIVYDDARHFILTTKEKFDVITSDPIHPWVKGAATLYTKEYFELVKQHLNPGGVVTQWVPLYESSPDVVKSEVATFFNVFPDGTIWSNDIQGKGYDVVLAGHATPQTINVDSMQARLARPGELAASRNRSARSDFIGGCRCSRRTPARRAISRRGSVGAEINRDSNLRLQYLAGMGLNTYQNAAIYDEMLRVPPVSRTICSSAATARSEYLRSKSLGTVAAVIRTRAPLVAITHVPSPKMQHYERTFVDDQPIDLELARRQHEGYRDALRDCGADVDAARRERDDARLRVRRRHGDRARRSGRDDVARRAVAAAEPAGIEPALAQYRPIARVTLPATIDGGDVVVSGRDVYVGESPRTNEQGIAALRATLAPYGYAVARYSGARLPSSQDSVQRIARRPLSRERRLDRRLGAAVVEARPGARCRAVGGRRPRDRRPDHRVRRVSARRSRCCATSASGGPVSVYQSSRKPRAA